MENPEFDIGAVGYGKGDPNTKCHRCGGGLGTWRGNVHPRGTWARVKEETKEEGPREEKESRGHQAWEAKVDTREEGDRDSRGQATRVRAREDIRAKEDIRGHVLIVGRWATRGGRRHVGIANRRHRRWKSER